MKNEQEEISVKVGYALSLIESGYNLDKFQMATLLCVTDTSYDAYKSGKVTVGDVFLRKVLDLCEKQERISNLEKQAGGKNDSPVGSATGESWLPFAPQLKF